MKSNLEKKGVIKLGYSISILILLSLGFLHKNKVSELLMKSSLSINAFYGLIMALFIIVLPLALGIILKDRNMTTKNPHVNRLSKRSRMIEKRKKRTGSISTQQL